jgi:hypothetical protein
MHVVSAASGCPLQDAFDWKAGVATVLTGVGVGFEVCGLQRCAEAGRARDANTGAKPLPSLQEHVWISMGVSAPA